MKIRSLTLKNIGVFEDETISFPEKQDKKMAVSTGAEIHILTGQNGTGKTTILQALASGMLQTDYFINAKFEDKNEISTLYLNKEIIENFTKKFQKDAKGFVSFSSGLEVPLKSNSEVIKDEKVISLYLKTRATYFLNQGLEYAAFSYSNYRLISHISNIDINELSTYKPLENALDFSKDYYKNNDYTLNKWLAINSSKRALARESNDIIGVERFDRNIKNIEQIVSEITNQKIRFEIVYDIGLKVVANVNGKKLDFDLLPDGLRSIISWLGDLIMRMDALKWQDDLPIFEREFILFLDEIEVHLHPSWQRKILPVVQKLFKNAQIFITTHSPFIVNSVDGAYIYELKLDANGHCKSEKPTISSTSMPIDEVLNEIYDIEPTQMYGQPVEHEIEDFQTELEKAYKKDKDFDKKELLNRARKLALKSPDLRNNVQFELRQLSKNLAEDFTI